MEKKFGYKNPKPRYAGKGMYPWEHTLPAIRMAPHVWNVGGNDNVGVFALDTGEGIILIDSGYECGVYLVIDRMYSVGLNPHDVKKILCTHYHGDHTMGARILQELAGGPEKCQIWLSKADEENHQRTKDETFPMAVLPYETTNFYEDENPIVMGRFTIQTRLCPGHTLGVTSMFFDDTDEETGKTYHVAIHGGMGTAMMKPGTRTMEHENVTPEVAYQFVEDCMELAKMPVDINLASHLNQANYDECLPEDLNDYTWWVSDTCWHDMCVNRAENVMSFYPEKYGDFTPTVPNID